MANPCLEPNLTRARSDIPTLFPVRIAEEGRILNIRDVFRSSVEKTQRREGLRVENDRDCLTQWSDLIISLKCMHEPTLICVDAGPVPRHMRLAAISFK